MRKVSIIFNRLPTAMLALVAVGALGCGGDRARVTGHVVRSDGKPLASARVIARSENGKSAMDSTDQDGQFNLSAAGAGDGIEPGQYTVIVVEDRGRTDNMRPPSISTKYADPAQSGLTFSVEPGEEKVFDITLEPL